MTEKHPRIVVVGSINMDLVVSVKELPAAGETIMSSSYQTIPGGKGANQAIAASRLGAEVTMIGCVGTDSFGASLKERLKQENINTEYVGTVPETKSGTALITLDEKGENTIIVAAGANAALRPAAVEEAEDVIQSADVLLVQLEIPLETVEAALALARRHQVQTILNPAPARKLPPGVLAQVDILTPNETEAKTLFEGEGIELLSVLGDEDWQDFAEELGETVLLLTMGENGVVYISRKGVQEYPAYKMKAIDTTGAGDAFNGALAVALAEGKELEEMIAFAQKAASVSVTRFGAAPSLPSRKEVESD